MELIAQFDSSAIANAIVEYTPARTIALGKTVTERRLSVIRSATSDTKMFAVNQAGKIGKAAREGMASEGIARITANAARGNYKPLSEALALIMGESCFITNRASFESLVDRFAPMAEQLEEDGKAYKMDKKGVMQMTAKYKQVNSALSLIQCVYDGVDAIFAQKDAA